MHLKNLTILLSVASVVVSQPVVHQPTPAEPDDNTAATSDVKKLLGSVPFDPVEAAVAIKVATEDLANKDPVETGVIEKRWCNNGRDYWNGKCHEGEIRKAQRDQCRQFGLGLKHCGKKLSRFYKTQEYRDWLADEDEKSKEKKQQEEEQKEQEEEEQKQQDELEAEPQQEAKQSEE